MIPEQEDGLSGIAELVPVKTRASIVFGPLSVILLLFTGWCTLPACHVHNRFAKPVPVPDGNHPVNLTRHPANDYLPSWSPDGRHILFSSNRDHEQGEIYRMNADGSGVLRLTHNAYFEEVPTWSPDGKQFLSTRQISEAGDTAEVPNGEIFLMDRDGKNEKWLAFKKGYDSGAKFSPDGEWLAYTSGTPLQYDVWVLHLSSGNKIRLTDEPKRNESPVWKRVAKSHQK